MIQKRLNEDDVNAPHLLDDGRYTRYLTPYQPGGGIRNDAAQTY